MIAWGFFSAFSLIGQVAHFDAMIFSSLFAR